MIEAFVVRHDLVVCGTPPQAFAAFTERMGEFKPKEHNLLSSPIASTTFEPRVGGHIVDRVQLEHRPSTGTARAGKRCAMESPTSRTGRSTWPVTLACWSRRDHRVDRG